ncbi:MAG: PAS domain S-box protein [Myxococcales bacterium]
MRRARQGTSRAASPPPRLGCPGQPGRGSAPWTRRNRRTRNCSAGTRKLEARAQELDQFFESNLDLLCIADTSGHFVRLNAEWKNTLGYEVRELVGRQFLDFIHPDDRAATRAAMAALREGQRVLNFENRYLAKDGSVRWIEWRSFPLGERAYAAARDVTARHEMEERLRRSEERYRLINDSSGDIIYSYDLQGRFTSGNRLLFAALGRPEAEVLGKTHAELGFPPQTCREWEGLHRRVLEAGATVVAPTTTPMPDGEVRHYRVVLNPLTDGQGAVVGIGGTTIDITEQVRAEREQKKLQEQLAQSQKLESIGRLAGGVAHDFNNMLGVILGHVDLALEEVDPAAPLRADLAEIRQAALRSAELTRQLLAFARKQDVSPRLLDLNATVTGMLKMLRRLIGEDLALEWRPAPGALQVRMDPAQVDQILANLCVNARDAIAGNGRVVIATREVQVAGRVDAPAGRYVQLSVTDDGVGMDAEVLRHLFEPFFTTKPRGLGTGLGLATVHGTVQQAGGFVEVESAPGQGACFKVYLPAQDEVSPEASFEGAEAGDGRAAEQPVRPVTVLLVEDERALLDLARTMLEKRGHTVLAAAHPNDALLLALQHAGELDLLVTDVVMPQMNGRDLAQQLLARFPRLRRLFVSGHTSNIIDPASIVADGGHFLKKPFTPRELDQAVRKALEAAP